MFRALFVSVVLFLSTSAQAMTCELLLAAMDRLAQNLDPGVPREAFEPRVDALPVNLEALIAMAQGDPVYGPRLDRVLAGGNSLREQIVALAKDGELRRLLVQAAHSDLIRRSNEEQARGDGKRVDVAIVGAGLVEQNLQNSLRQQPKEVETLTYETTNLVASTFARGGAAFFLNSTSRPADPTSLRQRTSGSDDATGGDLNFLPGGVVQVNQFDARNNPLARSWAEAATANRVLAPGNIVFGQTTDAIELAEATSREFKDGYVLRMVRVGGKRDFAKSAVVTGIGEDDIPDVPGLKELYAKYGPKKGSPTPPRVMTFTDLLTYINSTPNPYRLFSNNRVGVIGPGDSGKGVVRFALGLADPSAYGQDARDLPLVKSLLWYGQPCLTCDDFISRNRSFYADLGRGYRSNKILPRAKLASAGEGAEGVFRLGTGTGPEDEADVLIVTAGFKSELARLLRSFLTPEQIALGNALVEQPGLFRPVEAFEPSVGRVIIARQFVDPRSGKPLSIYVLGPSAGRIVSEPELVGVPENFVANVNHSWRAYRFGGLLADGLGRPRSVPPRLPREEWQRASSVRNESIEPKTVPSSVAGPQPGDTLLLASELYLAFSRYDLTNLKELTVTIARGEGKTFTIRVEPALSATQQTTVLQALARNEVFGNLLERNIGAGQRYQTVVVELKVGRDGRLNGEETRARLLQQVPEAVAQGPAKPKVTAQQMRDLESYFYRSEDGREYSRLGGPLSPQNAMVAKGLSGYSGASRLFNGDMGLTYDMARQLFGEEYLRSIGWSRFEGTRQEFDALRSFLFLSARGGGSYSDRGGPVAAGDWLACYGPRGMVAAAREVGRDLKGTYDGAVQLFGEPYVRSLGWYRFTGTIEEHDALRELVTRTRDGRGNYADSARTPGEYSAAYGNEGYFRAAEIFDGDTARAYDSAVEIYGEDEVRNRLRWVRMADSD